MVDLKWDKRTDATQIFIFNYNSGSWKTVIITTRSLKDEELKILLIKFNYIE